MKEIKFKSDQIIKLTWIPCMQWSRLKSTVCDTRPIFSCFSLFFLFRSYTWTLFFTGLMIMMKSRGFGWLIFSAFLLCTLSNRNQLFGVTLTRAIVQNWNCLLGWTTTKNSENYCDSSLFHSALGYWIDRCTKLECNQIKYMFDRRRHRDSTRCSILLPEKVMITNKIDMMEMYVRTAVR